MNERLRLRETSGLWASEPSSACSPRQPESPESLACLEVLADTIQTLGSPAARGRSRPKTQYPLRSSRVRKGHPITSFHFWEWGRGMWLRG